MGFVLTHSSICGQSVRNVCLPLRAFPALRLWRSHAVAMDAECASSLILM